MSACSAAANSVAGAAEAGRDLVQHERDLVLRAEVAEVLDAFGRVEAHPARTLHDRLDDHAREACSSRTDG